MPPLPLRKSNEGKAQQVSVRQLLRDQRELDEKRKFGLAPLALDAVTGQEISPNVPQSIARAPWYYGVSGTTLEHQRKKAPDGTDPTDSYDRLNDEGEEGVVVVGRPTRFVAGACANCGSRTHKTPHCLLPKKKVGAKYTGVVTGVDVKVVATSDGGGSASARKRDRFVDRAGVDLLRQSSQTNGKETGKDKERDPNKRAKPEEAFAKLAAQHGGLEIQPLPKYLENLDEKDIFFDPKMGVMRENPNAHDPTRLFQGDLQRYRSGDYYNYVESQYRYLTGQSKSFVDFALDEELGRERGLRKIEGGEEVSTSKNRLTSDEEIKDGKIGSRNSDDKELPVNMLVHSLYGSSEDEHTRNVAKKSLSSSLKGSVLGTAPTVEAPYGSEKNSKGGAYAPSASGSSAIQTEQTHLIQVHEKLMRLTHNDVTTYGDHGYCFGSYFNTEHFLWGFKCCRGCKKDSQCAPELSQIHKE
ncbi:unnamed protein product [Phytomonas sp. Hart1]|nr:unnamed protein product [Phytomonas sp. Hart1]|eukprot:CCW68472.1 unnamed protein product [Phytomonas sp. isolate Hart1]